MKYPAFALATALPAALVGVFLVHLLGCGEDSGAKATKAADAVKAGERTPVSLSQKGELGALIKRLVERGDLALASKSEAQCRAAYEFALEYAPGDAAIMAKQNAVPSSPPKLMDQEDYKRSMEITQACLELPIDEVMGEGQPSTPEAELVELRILLEPRLVGALNFGGGTFQTRDGRQYPIQFFLGRPTMEMKEVQAQFGKPGSSTTLKGGATRLTYGRFRVVCSSAGKVDYVLFTRKR